MKSLAVKSVPVYESVEWKGTPSAEVQRPTHGVGGHGPIFRQHGVFVLAIEPVGVDDELVHGLHRPGFAGEGLPHHGHLGSRRNLAYLQAGRNRDFWSHRRRWSWRGCCRRPGRSHRRPHRAVATGVGRGVAVIAGVAGMAVGAGVMAGVAGIAVGAGGGAVVAAGVDGAGSGVSSSPPQATMTSVISNATPRSAYPKRLKACFFLISCSFHGLE